MTDDRGGDAPRRSWGTRRPPWWPQGEPYPPARGEWPRMRGPFMRRFAAMFVGAFLFFGFVVAAFITILVNIFRDAITGGGIAAFIPLTIVVLLLFGTAARGFRRFAAPLGDLIDAAESIEAGNYGVRVRARGPRELRSLASAFNSMSGRLESSERERRRLLADVTHELRTPLTIMQGNLEALLDGVYPADAAHLEPILDETRVLSRLVDDLRTLSLAEAGALTLHLEPTDVGQLLTDSVASFRIQADAAGIELATALDGVLPQTEIDPVRMREVLSNLLSNALRYTPRGGTVRVGASVADGKLHVSVRDSGPGIAAEALPHIFDRFYKSDESRGAGLGLAIAKSLVVAHGGEIEAKSDPGQGTEMRFTFPVAPEASAP
ncbi:MAG: HAMP domain-containing histidine kinase [Chloroflexota bacterium]|nr:HAMP domain-containing histidine kinase [Chloroflexota bacterium]